MRYTCRYLSPLGPMMLEYDDQAIYGLWFTGQKYSIDKPFSADMPHDNTVAAQTFQWLDCYFSGGCPGFTPPIVLQGTAFQHHVWEILQRIPYGETTTYGTIAKELANARGVKRMSAQAVGGAVGRNPIGIIVPCHRVIGSQGNLTGYAAGIDKKIQLLRLENVGTSRLFRPSRGTAL